MCLCVYVSYVFMCIQQQLTTLKNNDLLFLLFCLYCLYSVYTYKQQQTPKILFSLFFIFFFCFFSLFLCFLFFLSFAAPQDYYTPVYAKIRPIFFPSFSTIFLRPVYELKHIAQIIITVFVGIVREPLFKKSDSRALSCRFAPPKNASIFRDPMPARRGFVSAVHSHRVCARFACPNTRHSKV